MATATKKARRTPVPTAVEQGVRFIEGDLPSQRSGKVLKALAPLLQEIKNHPGNWARIATGKNVSGLGAQLRKNPKFKGFEFVSRGQELYARYNVTEQAKTS